MAGFPLICNFQGDYGLKVLMVDDENTIEQVIDRAVELLAGVVVPRVTNRGALVARVQDSDDVLDPTKTVKGAGLVWMEAIEIYRPKS